MIIMVKGYERGNAVIIGVSDNGAGMTPESLALLRESIYGRKTGGKSKGLKNVNERIRLTFGEDYGMKIYSAEGKGVCLFLKLPKEI